MNSFFPQRPRSRSGSTIRDHRYHCVDCSVQSIAGPLRTTRDRAQQLAFSGPPAGQQRCASAWDLAGNTLRSIRSPFRDLIGGCLFLGTRLKPGAFPTSGSHAERTSTGVGIGFRERTKDPLRASRILGVSRSPLSKWCHTHAPHGAGEHSESRREPSAKGRALRELGCSTRKFRVVWCESGPSSPLGRHDPRRNNEVRRCRFCPGAPRGFDAVGRLSGRHGAGGDPLHWSCCSLGASGFVIFTGRTEGMALRVGGMKS